MKRHCLVDFLEIKDEVHYPVRTMSSVLRRPDPRAGIGNRRRDFNIYSAVRTKGLGGEEGERKRSAKTPSDSRS